MHYLTLVVLGTAVICIGIFRLYTLFKKINDPNKVPGPTLFPYVGRVHDLPIKFMWLKFYEWARQCAYIVLGFCARHAGRVSVFTYCCGGRYPLILLGICAVKTSLTGIIDSGSNGFYMVDILGTPILVVTDEVVAEELMVRRAKYNSDRPEIRSIVDSKSTDGSMEYLPLMGKNRTSPNPLSTSPLTTDCRVLGSAAPPNSRLSN